MKLTNPAKFAIYILISIVSIALCIWLHSISTEQRGYPSIGGEIMVLAIPLLVYVAEKTLKDAKEYLADLSSQPLYHKQHKKTIKNS